LLAAEIRFLPYNLRMIRKDLLDILVCPACKKPLVLKDNGESLKCGECHRVYPIRDDIPIMLVDQATVEP
jgi:LSD1 subclass zinc finger protein